MLSPGKHTGFEKIPQVLVQLFVKGFGGYQNQNGAWNEERVQGRSIWKG